MNLVIITCIPITEYFFKDSTSLRGDEEILSTYQDALQYVCKVVYLAVQTTGNLACKKTWS